MQLSIPIPQNIKCKFLIFFFFFVFFSPFLSYPQTNETGLLCGSVMPDGDPTPNFIPNFVIAMDRVSKDVKDHRWGAEDVISPKPEVYTYAQCYGFLSPHDCLSCFAESKTKLPKCLPAKSARIYLDGCFLRYDTYSFFREALDKEHDKVSCSSPTDVSTDEVIKREFSRKVEQVVSNVTGRAVKNKNKFALADGRGAVEAVYAMAQCWMELSDQSCETCLLDARLKIKKCEPGSEGRVMNAGCYLMYSTNKFYKDGPYSDAHKETSDAGVIIICILSAIALSMLALFGALLGYKRISQRRKAQNILCGISMSGRRYNLHFKYEMLEKATNYFDDARKLGQGGAGSVFKGTLPDGTTVAVKRLFFNTRQWVDEFFNEVNLISGIQHKNLVRLLGCSIEGPESLLVYEYVPNKSLDQVLFYKNTLQLLNWQQRFDIILGTALGLSYLHGGCGVKIIHRDIKTSNILLDENLTPKIADFGLARGVASDKSHISTGVAGTLGYMAPEYLVKGQLTDKADVYAFGVLVLEVVCGRKNSVFTQGSTAVLHSVWKHYKSNKISESVDASLKGTFPVSEASKVLQIGLLCTQTSITIRPSMSEVVQMLSDKDCVIPLPRQPPFLNSSVLNASESTRSSNMSTSTSNLRTTAELSSVHSELQTAEFSSFYSANSILLASPESSSISTIEASEPS